MAPNPERELERLESVLEAPDPPRVLLLSGPDRWFRDRALDLVKKTLTGGGEVVEMDGQERGESELGSFLLDLRTPDLFGGPKLCLLRHAGRILREQGKALAGALDRLAPGNALCFDVGKIDGRTSLARKIKKTGEVFEFRNLYAKPFRDGQPPESAEIVQWVRQRAGRRKVRLSAEAALFMIQVVGTDPARLEGELERLAPTLREGGASPETLRALLTLSFGSSQFDLVDALLGGDLPGALRSLRALCREGIRDREGKRLEEASVFPMVSAWLATSLAKLMEARFELLRGEERAAVVARHGGWFKDRFEAQLGRQDGESLGRMHEALVRAELRLRRSGEGPEVLLERLILEALGKGRTCLLGPGEEGLSAW